MRGSRPWGLGLIVAMAAVPWLAPGATAGLGPVVTEFPVPTAGSGPEAITTGPDGNLWFTEGSVNVSAIGRITPAGAITEFVMSCGLAFCRSSITPGPDGNLWFTSTSAATQAAGGCHGDVGRITPDGTITLGYALERSSRCGAAGCGGPTPDVCTYTDIATGPDGALWFTSESAIRRLSPDSALIATGAGAGGAAHVKLFGVDGVSGIPVQLGGGFLAYDPGFLGGVQAAVVAVGADVFVVTGVGSGGGPHIRLFQVTSFDDWTVAPVGGGFFAYDLGFTGGVRVAATTTAGSLLILTGVGQGGGAHVKVFQVTDLTTGAVVQLGGGFFAYDPGFLGGVNVGAQ